MGVELGNFLIWLLQRRHNKSNIYTTKIVVTSGWESTAHYCIDVKMCSYYLDTLEVTFHYPPGNNAMHHHAKEGLTSGTFFHKRHVYCNTYRWFVSAQLI